MNNDRQRRILALSLTLLISACILILLAILGLPRQTPPPPEFGVEINFGMTNVGMGDQQPDVASETEAAPPPSTSTNDPDQSIVTANTDEVSIKSKPKKNKKNNTPVEEQNVTPEQTPQPTINNQALYRSRKTPTNGSDGNKDQVGDQGDPLGSRDAKSYEGSPGPGGGGGVSFSLSGRQSKSLPKPSYTCDDQGSVVVKIWVNPSGQVVRVQAGEPGTTTADSCLWQAAEQAAIRSKFSVNPNTEDLQVGLITYKFIRLN